MPIDANFNTLIFLKNFNNYFNRKVKGSLNLDDYLYGATVDGQLSPEPVLNTAYIEATFSDFENPSLLYYVLRINLDVPIDCELLNINEEISEFIFDYKYDVLKRELVLTHYGAPASPDAKIKLSYQFYSYGAIKRENINWNDNDGVATEIIANDLSFSPDYVLVIKDNEIVSRWFVLEEKRERSFQRNYKLKRDVIFDFLDNLQESPIFVQKGMLNEGDPFVVNDEGMRVNQIKKYEVPLKDKSKNAWIIFYIAKNTPLTDVYGPYGTFLQISGSVTRNPTKNQDYDMLAMPLYDCDIYLPSGVQTGHIMGEYSLLLASAIATALDANCYDVQLLPYCPFVERTEEGKIYVNDYGDNPNPDYSDITSIPSSAGSSTFTYLFEQDFEITFLAGETHPYKANISLSLLDLNIRYADNLSSITLTKINGPTIYNQDIQILSSHRGATIHLEFDEEPDFIINLQSFYTVGTSLSIGKIFYCSDATFKCELDKLSIDDTYLNLKELSNLTMQRFVSPNYQGSFEMNVGKNGGDFGKVYAYCTYKPYTPYIKIAPEFKFLYGQNFGDCRGLICGGDFSLPRATSAWQSYQLQNKNYQNIFNREIQTMDAVFKIDLAQQIAEGVIDVGTSAAAGAGAGAAIGTLIFPGVGTAIGAGIGAMIGGGASAVGMEVDTTATVDKYYTQRKLVKDKFSYQLGNIKALPYTLTKVGAFDISSKIWPFVEWYQCTDEEIEAFDKKIEYESMTVMRIDQISNYYHKFGKLCYFKGELIRNENIGNDYHVLLAIYDELLKGVYL